MDKVGEKLFDKAMAFLEENEDGEVGTLRKIAHAMRSEERGSTAWGDHRQKLHLKLEVGLRQWIKEHPPGTSGYGADQIDHPRYAYGDEVLEQLKGDDVAYRAVSEVLNVSAPAFVRVTKSTFTQLRSKARGGDKDRVAELHPKYHTLLADIRKAKKAWNEADRAIKASPSFRMMGGLARLGTPEGRRYRQLVEEAQRIEQAAIGKTLTTFTKAG